MDRTNALDRRLEASTRLLGLLAERAANLPDEHKVLFAEALEQLQTSLEELDVAGEELVQQAEELAAARTAAEEDRQRYLDLFDLAPDAYLVTDESGKILEANRRAGVLLGVKSVASLLSKPLVVYVDRTDRKAFFDKLSGLKAVGGAENWEIYFRVRGGRTFPAEVDITPILGPKGAPTGFRWLVRDTTEAKKRLEQAWLATFPELNPEPVAEVDLAGHVYFLNRAGRRLFADLPEKGLAHPFLGGLSEAAARLGKSGRRVINNEVEIEGRWFARSLWSPPHSDRIRIFGRDVTELKEAQERLREYQGRLEEQVQERTAELLDSTELLERVFSSVDLAIAYLDTNFDFRRVNRAFADAFGHEPSWYPGRNLFALYPEPEALALFRKVLETGESHTELESPFLRGAPREGTLWDWSVQRVTAGDDAAGVVLSLVDVTERVKLEEEGRRLSTAIEQSEEALVITDTQDRIVYANKAFGRRHQLSAAGAVGRLYGEILQLDRESEDYRASLRDSLARTGVWKGRLTRPVEGRPDGKLDVTISAVRDPSGRTVNYAILERDSTREHRLEASVRGLQKLDALGTLAGGIAHDFNNILVPIFINAEMAALEAGKDSPISPNLTLVLEAASRGRELVRQIIAFSRPAEQTRDVVDMTAVVKETLKFLRSSIPRSIAIHERFSAAPGLVRADPSQIGQILLNLGTNAAYAMRELGGRLTIGLSDTVVEPETAAQNPGLAPGPYVKLTVEDTGSGIPGDVLERIFDPFFTTKRRGEGTGMGLSVVRGIVQGHGGAIAVSSVPGQGTTFDVYLPAAKGEVRAAKKPSARAAKGRGRILYVDDEEILVRSVRPMLERLGFSVFATTDPYEALELVRRRPADFDLVITDETMPGLTGGRLAAELLRIRPDLPIILSTGFSESIREEELPAKGIRGFIMKPFSMGEIADKIQSVLKSS